MNLDVNTLFLVTIYVEAILGLLLLFAWVQNTAITAVAWWGFAHLLRAASVMLFGMYGSVSDLISIDLANAILFTAFALTWTGARVFDHRRPQPILLFAGAALWLVLCRMPRCRQLVGPARAVSSGIITAYTWATAYEFWRGRSEPLVSRWPAIFMLFAHGSLYLLRTPFGAMLPWSPTSNEVFESVWLDGAQLRGAAVHHRDRLHPARDGQGTHRASSQDRGADRSADRHRQPPRVPAGRRSPAQAPGGRSAADRGDAARPRQFQIDQRPLRPCHRRSRAAAFCRDRRPLHAPRRPCSAASAARNSPRCCSTPRATARSRSPKQIRAGFAEATGEVDGRPVLATVSIGIVISHDAVARSVGAAGAGRPRALPRQGQRPQPRRDRLARAHPRSRQARRRRPLATAYGKSRQNPRPDTVDRSPPLFDFGRC